MARILGDIDVSRLDAISSGDAVSAFATKAGTVTLGRTGQTLALAGNVTVAGTLAGQGALSLTDGDALILGTGSDDTIVHTGAATTWTHTTGDLTIDNTLVTGSTIIQMGTDTAATDFQIQNNTGTALLTVDGLGRVIVPTAGVLHLDNCGVVKQCTYNSTGGAAAPTAAQILDGYIYNGNAGAGVALTIPAATAMQTELLARGITSAAGMICGEIIVNVLDANALTATAADGTVVVDGTSAAFNAQCGRITYIMTGAATAVALCEKDT